ncbi:hypothetical protein CPC16_007670 [Podila verticillata]|uniref:Histone deacetylase complex subunit SAP30 Sin3 binding domain-containing protein n=1 Tax=Podila verticillata NRRL 6337 TaxID=1069443 RepID=A0A086TJR6_9FUNG|nr:hypothetical protein BGZ59_005775 [Podila verticillata]KAF9395618.1 hypothetical protein CPC16_007670 [Podila verticillata]KAI9234287.1 MAG: hypothetical protein BYD32DRAFT_423934 [Podila humilis]KFH62193.1 hypothetical protein MVEG_11831 [Podila verticillata NRRL 6337]
MAPKLKAGESGHSASASSSNAKGSSHAGTSSHHASSSDRNHANGTNTHSTASDRGTPGASERSGLKDEKSGSGGSAGVKRKAESQVIAVDFSTMDIAALRRYCRLNKLKPSSRSHDDLVTVATKHWQGVNAKEVDSVAYFLFAVKHRHNVLKLTMPLP